MQCQEAHFHLVPAGTFLLSEPPKEKPIPCEVGTHHPRRQASQG